MRQEDSGDTINGVRETRSDRESTEDENFGDFDFEVLL